MLVEGFRQFALGNGGPNGSVVPETAAEPPEEEPDEDESDDESDDEAGYSQVH